MIKQARQVVQAGELGTVNKVVVEYPQGWLSGFLRGENAGAAPWRMDPKVAGASCCMGDIGTHAENLARYVTGLEIESLCADLTAFIDVNQLDDDGGVLLRYKGGARGVLMASQISVGEENNIRLRVYGSEAGLDWRQEDPNYLLLKYPDGRVVRYSKGNGGLCPQAEAGSRIPPGHPEAFIEAFANIYLAAYSDIRAGQPRGATVPAELLSGPGGPESPLAGDYPTVDDGVVGMAFIETVVESARSNEKWTAMKA
jgi:predicted dehydrogenase